MNKRPLVVVVAGAMLALIASAFVYDCVRLAAQARGRVELADQDLSKHEERLATLLDSPTSSPEVRLAVAAYRDAADPQARRAAYDQLVAAVRQTVETTVDPTDPLARKFMDDVAGAINRRERAEAPYDAEVAAYQGYLDGLRGNVAAWFSPADAGAAGPR